MKIAIIGAGSSYTPELFEKLAEKKEELPVKLISLMDIDEGRLEAMSSFCRRYAEHLGMNVKIESTLNMDKAINGANFVNVQIRVGGNESRKYDEKIPLEEGFIGQETTGAGGFMKALRTIPEILKIAKSIEENSPDAWLINYTNPTGIISQAIHDYTKIKCAALCAGGLRNTWNTASALGVDARDVQYDIFGLNHLNFTYNIKVRGRSISKEEFNKVLDMTGLSPEMKEMAITMEAIPSAYLQYYYHRVKKIEGLKKEAKSRAEVVLDLEKEIFEDLKNPAFVEKPNSLKKRGGDGYAEVAAITMDAIHNNRDSWGVVNIPNRSIYSFLPYNAVIETAVMINAHGIRALITEPPPKAVWGLVSMVKNYEMLTAEAAVTGDRDTALMALTHHPLVMDYDAAKILLARLMEAHKDYLPQFQ